MFNRSDSLTTLPPLQSVVSRASNDGVNMDYLINRFNTHPLSHVSIDSRVRARPLGSRLKIQDYINLFQSHTFLNGTPGFSKILNLFPAIQARIKNKILLSAQDLVTSIRSGSWPTNDGRIIDIKTIKIFDFSNIVIVNSSIIKSICVKVEPNSTRFKCSKNDLITLLSHLENQRKFIVSPEIFAAELKKALPNIERVIF